MSDLREALTRLVPLIDTMLRSWVFTAEKDGEVVADMNTLRSYLSAGPAQPMQFEPNIYGHGEPPRDPAWPAQEMTDDLRRMLGELFGIGSAARDNATILANAENAARRARCLSAVEREFFTDLVPDEDNQDGPPSEECRLPWGAEPDEYVAAMRADRASRLPEMGEGEWPALPGPANMSFIGTSRTPVPVFTAAQYRAGQVAAVEAYKALVRGKT